MTLTDGIRALALTMAFWCYVLAATALYQPLAESYRICGPRHAAEIAPSEIIWQRMER